MEVDIRKLEAANRMAHEGAERAASHLSAMTDIETSVDVTRTHVRSDATAVERQQCVGVVIELDGGLRGRTAFTFPAQAVERVRDVLAPGMEDMDESLVRELGNVMAGGFVDGWADYLGTTIDISPPTYVDGDPTLLFDDADETFVFASSIGAVDESISFSVHLSPEVGEYGELLGDDGETVSVEDLSHFDEMTRDGATTVAENITAMTGIETTVEITHVSFVPVEEVPEALGDVTYVGVVIELETSPGGFVLILFDETSARDISGALLPGDDGVSDGELSETEQNAIQELGNIMASSFIDGWANALETTIDISPPTFAHDMGSAIADPLVAQLGQKQEFAFVSDATIRAAETPFDCSLYVLPDESELREVLSSLDADATSERKTNAGRL